MTADAHLTLAPASARGWFGGRPLAASGVIELRSGLSLGEAAEALQRQFEGGDSALTAVLAAYDGTCTVARFASVAHGGAAGSASSPPAAGANDAAPLLRESAWDLRARGYRGAVCEIRRRIEAGDVYVMNLTARLEGILAADSPEAAFESLRRRAAADMAALFTGLPGDTPWLASVSPERFLRVRLEGAGDDAARIAEISPIKGTRPRGATSAADAALAEELRCDPKELAEHVMIVDLERNDLGRACVPGSVTVEPLYEVVTTPYCHQLVSTVRGVLRPEASLAEVLEATFPCGSVTGAPKRAAMRITGELEASPRGAYCGALFVAIPGELDSSVLIRTLEGLAEDPARARYGSGAGITHDSAPVAEHLEVLLKASLVTGDRAPDVALRETMRVHRGRVPLLDRHLARLASGGVGPTVIARVRQAVGEQLSLDEAQGDYARLGVTVTPDGAVVAGLTLQPSSLAVEGGPVVALFEVAEPPNLPAGAAKPASRRYWDRAYRGVHLSGAHQALLHDAEGTLIDGSSATAWIVRDGRIATPLAPPAVAGVARELVFDIANRLGIPAEERVLTVSDFAGADEVFLSNAVGLVVAVRGRGGPVAARIAEAVWSGF